MKNKEIKEIRKLMTEVENRLQVLEAKTETERRLWNVDEICGKMECLTQNPYSKLKVVADYCNEMDKKTYYLIFPYWDSNSEDVKIYECISSYFATSYFNSEETLKRLISENTEFFEQLLKPKE